MASIYKSGERWRVQVRRAGGSQSKYFDTHEDAKRWARAQEHAHDLGKQAPISLRTSLRDLIEPFKESTQYKNYPEYRSVTARVLTIMGGTRLDELGPTKITYLIHKLESIGAGPTTVERNIQVFFMILRYGAARLGVSVELMTAAERCRAPLSALRRDGRLARSGKRERRVSEAELKELEAASHRRQLPAFDIILFALTTAMRAGEIARVMWEDFDEHARVITIRDRKDPKQKHGNDQRVPLIKGPVTYCGEIIDPVEIIKRQPTKAGKIFPYRAHDIAMAMYKIISDAGITDMRFHDLRHEAISRLFEFGFDIPEVSLISGHKTWENLKRYTQLRAENLIAKSVRLNTKSEVTQ